MVPVLDKQTDFQQGVEKVDQRLRPAQSAEEIDVTSEWFIEPDSILLQKEATAVTALFRRLWHACAMLFCLAPFVLASSLAAAPAPERLAFNRDIRPILSENCFYCHGQDAAHREAKLRLDERADAVRPRDGRIIIAPGRPEESELILRLIEKHADDRMPPVASNKHVTPQQIELLKRWISEGAEYEPHWAFIPPVRPVPPKIGHQQSKSENLIDDFVVARLAQDSRSLSPPAPPQAWLRRAAFDLTGLPPTPAELDAFAADVAQRGEPAFAAAADRLLASPHFGERQAIEWLDAARYADSHGFNNDGLRTMWRWRDWVIAAFNANQPYDRFITEQLAGDLLPNPTLDQRLATGFGRNHVINSEGGIIEEEYRVEYVADRVRTVSTALLGLTFECARCHDHKFDPISQKDYYRLFGFFNSLVEHGEDGRRANAVPMIPAPTAAQQALLADHAREIAALEARLAGEPSAPFDGADKERLAQLAAQARTAALPAGRAPLWPAPAVAAPFPAAALVAEPTAPAPKVDAAQLPFLAESGVTISLWLNPAADNPAEVALLSNLDYSGSPADAAYGRGQELRLIDGEVELRIAERSPMYAITVRSVGAAIRPGAWRHLAVSYEGKRQAAGVRVFVDGAEIATTARYDGYFSLATVVKRPFLVGADNLAGSARWRGALAEAASFPRPLTRDEVRAVFASIALPYAFDRLTAASATSAETHWLRDALRADAAATAPLHARLAARREEDFALRRRLPTAMVMQELPQPRAGFVLNRGNYDAPGEPVAPGVPEALLAPWPAGAPRNRLGLARWLTQPDHPLTARVVVNRFWAQLFGTGLVKTLEDFGSQSEWPSHPELLDWLAREFVDSGWNVKALFRTLVLSATYRQTSSATPDAIASDPENRLLARGPRLRLPAELIRDQALAVSGLLTPDIGGPSVYPYQPDKLYDGIVVGTVYPGSRWEQSAGRDLYRRSLYTFWKRTVPHPVMRSFDAPDREVCTVRRSRTNTPLQALALWNEPGYVEAARHLGARMLREGGLTAESRAAFAFRLTTGRVPDAVETRTLTAAFTRLRDDFAAHPADAAALLRVGASPVDPSVDPADFAAATAVANLLLNLDETITKN
jgi:cytochrome c553